MPTPTIINPTQSWAMTCHHIADLRDGFWNFCDNQSIDAPSCLPSGHTVGGEFEGVRYVNGSLAARTGA